MCELMILYILSLPQKQVNKTDNRLYRNGGLVVLRNANERATYLCREDIKSILRTIGFNIYIQLNLKIVDFLDVTFNLENGTYRPFKKPNDKLLICRHLIKPTTADYQANQVGERVSKTYQTRKYLKIKRRI